MCEPQLWSEHLCEALGHRLFPIQIAYSLCAPKKSQTRRCFMGIMPYPFTGM
jgi:hypothetical protein